MSPLVTNIVVRPIHFWQHWRAVGTMFRDYSPGTDVAIDHIRAASVFTRLALRHLLLPLYFAREQGWAIRDEHGQMVATIYLRRQARQGVRVMHIDNINVSARYRRGGLGQHLMALAEELAQREGRPFLKLAVTVANTPAVTLYQRLGYQEQHHRFFMYTPTSSATSPSQSGDVSLRPLQRRQAAQAFRRYFEMELAASAPAIASVLATYYPGGGGDISGLKEAQRGFALEQGGREIGYGDVYRQKAQWHLRLSLRPELWGTGSERQALLLLTSASGHEQGAPLALHVPTAAHFDAQRAGPSALARELSLVEKSAERMIMVKPLTPTP